MSRLLSIVIFLFAVLNAVVYKAQTPPSECKSETFSIPSLTKADGGWDVSFVKEARVLGRGELILGDGKDTGLQYVEYEAKKQVITLPAIEVNVCDHSGTIREWHLLPKTLVGFEKNGHLFAYELWVQMISGVRRDSEVIGSNTHIIFYDMHGDGVFDSVRLGASAGLPLVPDWVKSPTGGRATQ